MEAALFGILLGASFSYFLYQIYKRFGLTRVGRLEYRSDYPFERLTFLIRRVILQKNLKGYPFSALFHSFMMWGFPILSFSSLDMAWQVIFHSNLPFIGVSPVFLFLRDTMILLALFGVLGFLFRRSFFKPEWLHNSKNAYMILLLILSIVFSELSYLTLSVKIEKAPLTGSWLINTLSNNNFLDSLGSPMLLKFLWWGHFLLIFSFFYIIPRSKHLHLIFAPFNVYWHSLTPKGALISVDLDLTKEQAYGVKTVEDFTWKQLFDTFSCVKCGYCHGQCPSEQSKEWLKPKRINGRIRSYLEEKGFKPNPVDKSIPKVVGDLFHLDFIQSCTTCGGCNNACPVSIDHLSKIIDMRRTIVSEKVKLSSDAIKVFEGIEQYGNPWGQKRLPSYFSWAKDMKVFTLMEKPNPEYLLFMGCQATFEDSARKAAITFAEILQTAQVDFVLQGESEWCCGETVRRMGNEHLFQRTVKKNIATLNRLGIKKIITTCPHCYNTFQNEYSEFGGSYEVIPHSVLLANLLHQGILTLSNDQNQKITYHDPCYLSHHNDIYDEPRNVLSKIPGIQIIEMPRTKEKSFCCGSGGGRFWDKTGSQNPITKNRFDEILATETELIVTSCPYCSATFNEEIRCRELVEDVKAIDISELVSFSLIMKE